MLEIAIADPETGIFQKDIARRQSLSNKYLDSIISSLKASGLILNRKGRKSGYVLSRKPADISMHDIYRAFEPGVSIVDCLSLNYLCELSNTCGVRNFWRGLNISIEEYFKSFTLADLVREHENALPNNN